jgi:hypothetical protein
VNHPALIEHSQGGQMAITTRKRRLRMLKYLRLVPILFVVSAAEARPVKTEFVTGDGFLRSSFGISVEFAVDVSQRDPNDPDGWMIAAFFSFPQHLFMSFESTGLTSIAVDRRTALVTGTAIVNDTRTGFEGEVRFSAVFEDLDSRKKRSRNDEMSLTLYFPAGAETFSGGIVPGGIEVGTRRR